MTNDLKVKSEEFIKLLYPDVVGTKQLTGGEWGAVYAMIDYDGLPKIVISSNKAWLLKANPLDIQAMCQVPNMISHIAELQKRLDDYEARVQRLTENASSMFTSDQSQDMAEFCLQIMTEGK